MIITKLQGGLGNQMFQVAIAFAFAKYYNTNFKLDLSFLENNNKTTEVFTARDYELGVFSYNFKFADKNDIEIFYPKNKNILKKIILKIKKIILKSRIITDNWDTRFFSKKITKYTYFDGYWQSENYFKKYRNDILDLFKFPELSSEFANIKQEIINANSVSIHFRRGDYVKNEHIKSVHGICDFKYYQKASDFIYKKQKNIKFFLFSDEPDWVKNNFKSNINYTVINTGHSITDMMLMSLCKHNIIANSSFSWWGAWLNQNPDKIVIAPKKWFADNKRNTIDLIPNSWLKI